MQACAYAPSALGVTGLHTALQVHHYAITRTWAALVAILYVMRLCTFRSMRQSVPYDMAAAASSAFCRSVCIDTGDHEATGIECSSRLVQLLLNSADCVFSDPITHAAGLRQPRSFFANHDIVKSSPILQQVHQQAVTTSLGCNHMVSKQPRLLRGAFNIRVFSCMPVTTRCFHGSGEMVRHEKSTNTALLNHHFQHTVHIIALKKGV